MPDYDLGTATGRVVVEADASDVEKVNQELGKTEKVGKRAADSMTLDTALGKTSTAAVAAGATIVGGLSLAIKTATDFESQMSQVQAVLGFTTAEMEPLRAAALRIGEDTKYSAGEAAFAMEELAKQGLSASDILNGAADATVALAAAGGVDLTEAAGIAAAALNQFKLEASDLNGVVDVMAGAANASATGVSEIGMALSFVGPAAQTAGVSFEDAATMISLFANNGIDGARAGNALKAVITRMANPTDKAAGVMEKLGLITKDGSNQFFDAQGNMKSMEEVTTLLRDSMSGLTREQQIAYGQTLVGSANLSALGAITSSTAEEFKALEATIQSTSAADVAAARMDNLEGKLEEMMGSLETLAIKVGSVFIPAMSQIIQTINDVIDWFSNMDPAMQQFLAVAAMVTGGILLLVGAGIKVVMFVRDLVTAVQVIIPAIHAFNAALAANPIGLIVTAIAALVAGLIWFFTQTEVGKAIWAGFMQFLQDAWTNISSFLTDLWNGIVEVATTVFTAIADFFNSVWTTVSDIFTNVWNGIVDFLKPIFDVIGAIIKSAVEMWTNIFIVLAAVLKVIWDGISAAVKWVWEGISNFVRPIVEAIASFVGDTMKRLQTGWNIVWNAIGSFFEDVWNNIMNFVRPIVQWMIDYILPIIMRIQAGWNAAWGAIGDFFASIWNGIVSAVETAVSTVTSVVGGIYDTVMGIFNNVATWLYNVGKDLITGFFNGVQSMWGWITEQIGGFFNGIVDWAKDILGIASPSKVFKQLGKYVGQGFSLGIMGTYEEVKGAMSKMTDMVKDAYDNIIEDKKKATDKLADLNARLENAEGHSRTKILRQIAEQKKIIADANKFLATSESKTLKIIRDANKKLSALAKERDKKTEEIVKAREVYADAVSLRDDYKASMREGIIGQGDISEQDTLAEMEENLTNLINKTIRFRQVMEELGKRGLNDTSYKQLADAFESGGDLTALENILAGGQDAVDMLNKLQGQLEEAAGKAGSATSKELYQAGVDTARGIVQGLKDQRAEITELMEDIADDLVNVLKKALQIKSPSRVMSDIGVDTIAGLVRGMELESPEVGKMMSGLQSSLSQDIKANVNGVPTGGGDDNRQFHYHAAPGAGQLDGEQDLFTAMRRAKVVVPGW